MRLLFVTPRLTAVSEAWMRCMIDQLEDDIVAIAAHNPEISLWKNKIPVVPLYGQPGPAYKRVLSKLKLGYQGQTWRTPAELLQQAIERFKPDRVLVQYLDYTLQFKELWQNSPIPWHAHAHGKDTTWLLPSHEDPETNQHAEDYPRRVLEMSKSVQFLSAAKTGARRILSIGVPEDRVVVKYHGVHCPEKCPERSNRTEGLKLLYLGRLFDCKGPDLTIQAFDEACKMGLDADLNLAGDGQLMTMCHLLRKRSAYKDRIHLLGAVDWQTGKTLREEADIFTAHSCIGPLSNQEEVFATAFVEANGEALPVVSGHIDAFNEVLADKQTALLFEPGDIKAHARHLLDLAHDPEKRLAMGKAGWQRVRDHFSIAHEKQGFYDAFALEDEHRAKA